MGNDIANELDKDCDRYIEEVLYEAIYDDLLLKTSTILCPNELFISEK